MRVCVPECVCVCVTRGALCFWCLQTWQQMQGSRSSIGFKSGNIGEALSGFQVVNGLQEEIMDSQLRYAARAQIKF